MHKPLLLIFMTMGVAMAMSFFYDLTTLTAGTEEMRTTTNSAAQEMVINHLDWATLRTGSQPVIMDELQTIRGEKERTETIKRALTKDSLLPISRLQARTVIYPAPALVGVSARTGNQSILLNLLDDPKNFWAEREAIYIIESVHENYNY